MSICNILVLITVAIQVAECIYDQGGLHPWTPCVTPQTGSLCREIPAAASPPHHHCHHLHSRVCSPAPHRRRKLLGKQPQVQPGARRGTDNKATTVEEHQASGRLSTPAADSGGGVSADTDEQTQIPVPKQPKGSGEAVYAAAALEGQEDRFDTVASHQEASSDGDRVELMSS